LSRHIAQKREPTARQETAKTAKETGNPIAQGDVFRRRRIFGRRRRRSSGSVE